MINFKDEVTKIKDQMIQDIIDLCAIPSTQDDNTVGPNQPFGKPCRDALDAMLEIGKRDGYVVDDVDGYAGHIDIGEGTECIGVLGHLDVVPVNAKGWDSDPFTVITKDNKLYGRGVADDKGPLIAGYYAAKILHDMQIPLSKKIRVIFGCNEELGSACVKYYFENRPYPVAGFTPDGGFPVIYGEKAGGHAVFTGVIESDELISMGAGSRVNIVPETCQAIIKGDYKKYEDSFNAFLLENGLSGSIEEEGNHSHLVVVGKSCHASTPEVGKNAIVYMAKYLQTVINHPVVSLISQKLNDYHGQGMNVAFTGEMGPYTMNPGVISYRKGKLTIGVDMRCPHDIDFINLEKSYRDVASEYNIDIDYQVGDALHVDINSHLIQSLHQAYTSVSGRSDEPQAIGGGTYAKSMPNCVAFGPEFVGEDNKIHENNECIDIDSLLLATEIYVNALYNLAK